MAAYFFIFNSLFFGFWAGFFFKHPYRVYWRERAKHLSSKELADRFFRASLWAVPLGTLSLLFWVIVIGLMAQQNPQTYEANDYQNLLLLVYLVGIVEGFLQYSVFLRMMRGDDM